MNLLFLSVPLENIQKPNQDWTEVNPTSGYSQKQLESQQQQQQQLKLD